MMVESLGQRCHLVHPRHGFSEVFEGLGLHQPSTSSFPPVSGAGFPRSRASGPAVHLRDRTAHPALIKPPQDQVLRRALGTTGQWLVNSGPTTSLGPLRGGCSRNSSQGPTIETAAWPGGFPSYRRCSRGLLRTFSLKILPQ
jgi:hypothetical protein